MGRQKQVVDARERFRALFVSAYPSLRRYAHHRGITGADAEDLVAEVLTVAWRRLDAVPADDPLPWLFAVAKNLRRNDLRRSGRLRRLGERLPAGADVAMHISEPADVEGAVIADALTALRDDDRELLVLIAWDGLTPAQAAGVLGCSPATLRVRLHRARKRFAEELARRETGRPPTTVRLRDHRTEGAHDGA